jgi:hypothetical protein
MYKKDDMKMRNKMERNSVEITFGKDNKAHNRNDVNMKSMHKKMNAKKHS